MERPFSRNQPDFTEQVTDRAGIRHELDSAIDRCRVQHDLTDSPLFARVAQMLAESDSVLLAHYYVDANLQALAEASGGFVGDSLQMAQFGADANAEQIIIAGVRFMAETAKMLSPHKTVRIIDSAAECSLDLSCPPDQFRAFCANHPERRKVVYANTSAEVKAQADWVVTSSIAREVIEHLTEEDEPIIWAPDKHLGAHLQEQTGADMLLWDGACVVHEEFKADAIHAMRHLHPHAGLLAHPESPNAVLQMADAVGSTSQLIAAAARLPQQELIVATDSGIFYKMQQAAPEKNLIIAPTQGKSADCKSCAHCPWMGLNDLNRLHTVLEEQSNEIILDPTIIRAASKPLKRMLDFGRSLQPA